MRKFFIIYGISAVIFLTFANYRGLTVGRILGKSMKESVTTVGTTRGIYHK